jgi:hypothetical protein
MNGMRKFGWRILRRYGGEDAFIGLKLRKIFEFIDILESARIFVTLLEIVKTARIF